MAHTRRLNYRTDKSYKQTILTAYRRNFHYLFEFPDILPIFAKQLLEFIFLFQPCRWCSMVGLSYCISFIPIISPCIIIFGGVGHFCVLNRTKFLVICKSLLFSRKSPYLYLNIIYWYYI